MANFIQTTMQFIPIQSLFNGENMKIWIARHGETALNAQKLMQGITDEPLNEKGIEQAERMHEKIKNVHFDAVYASPLDRAQVTASILSGVDRNELIIDDRLIEVNFGKYELKKYTALGVKMTLYYLFQQYLPAPKTVEKHEHIVERAKSFLEDLKKNDYENVLIVSHGNLIRVMYHQLDENPPKTYFKDFPGNCEIRVYEVNNNKSFKTDTIKLED